MEQPQSKPTLTWGQFYAMEEDGTRYQDKFLRWEGKGIRVCERKFWRDGKCYRVEYYTDAQTWTITDIPLEVEEVSE